MTPEELLAQHGIKIASTAPGRYYTLCPQCSAGRKPENRKSKCLGVTIDANGVRWGCNNCNWTGPEKGTGRANGYAGGDEDFDATYDYTKDGVVRFQKVRKPGKKFFIRRPDGNGGWINDAQGVDTSILYRIDDVNEAIAQGQLIAIAEGERDVDNLWRIGIPATCNAHGAHDPKKNQKPKWYAAHSEQLRGADIVILNDNDDSGRAHAEAAARLSVGIAARVRMLDLTPHWPEVAAKKGGDVSDGLDAGRTREELDELIARAPEFDAVKIDSVVHVSFWVTQFTPPDYVVGGLIQRGFSYSLTGLTGAGKTGVAVNLSALVASPLGGQMFGPHEVEPGRVLYIPAENQVDVQMRFIGLGQRVDLQGLDLFIQSDVKTLITDFESEFARLFEFMKRLGGFSLVIVDTSPSLFPGDSENDNVQMLNHAKRLRRFTDMPGNPATLALCHPVKNASSPDQLIPRGGGSYIGEVDGNLTLWAHDETLVDLHWCGKFRGPSFEKFTFKHETITTTKLVDTKGRLIPTVVTSAVTAEEAAKREEISGSQEDRLLVAMLKNPAATLEALAVLCRWFIDNDPQRPNKFAAHRVMKRLEGLKLVIKQGRTFVLTKTGMSAAKAL